MQKKHGMLQKNEDVFCIHEIKTQMWNPILLAIYKDKYLLFKKILKDYKGMACVQFWLRGSQYMSENQAELLSHAPRKSHVTAFSNLMTPNGNLIPCK